MAGNGDLEQKLKAGVDAARRGDRTTARRLLEQVVTADANNELAWIWLASCVNTLSERRACLERVLQINPANTRAREALQKLVAEDRQQRASAESSAAERIRRIEQASSPRTAAPRPAADGGTGSRMRMTYLLVGGLVIISIAIAAFFGSSLIQRLQPPTPTRAAALAPTASETPSEPSATPTFRPNVVDTRTVPTLPPTFTPTPTATPTTTPTATNTPYPLSNFVLYFTVLRPGDVEPALYRMNADGSNIEFVADAVREMSIDASGRKIAFVRDVTVEPDDRSPDGGTWPEIFVAPLANLDDATQITDLRRPVLNGLSWAVDGVQLVFASDFDGDEELWSMTDDGQNVRQLTFNEGGIDRDPAWDPQQEDRIVFASDRDTPGLTEIYALRLDPTDGDAHTITRFTNDNGSSYAPFWSPDGTKIAFISDRGGDGDVFFMDQDGQRPQLLTFDDGDAEDRQAVFSPDSRLIYFVSNREDGIFQIYLVNLRGSELVRIAEIEGDVQTLAFRPEPLLGVR